jgi:hypothetical protein
MSSALAVAGVTAVLRGMIESWLDDNDANAALNGASASVTAVAPDTVALSGAAAGPKLNLFLHQVTQNPGWRNMGLPSRDSRGHQISAPPLAINLHYLLTAYGPEELQAEVLLGYGMQVLHERPVLDRAAIQARLPAPLKTSHLAQQVEQIKVTLEPMTSEELSRLWSAMQAKYRPTASYQVSVLLIEAQANGRATQPVLSRGVFPTTELVPPLPGIDHVEPPDQQPVALLGDDVTVHGHHLDGANRGVRIENRILDVDREIAAAAGNDSDQVRFTIPNQPAALAIGTYALSVLVQRPGDADRRETNRLPLAIVPRITTGFPLNVARDGQGTAQVDLAVRPNVRPFQRVSLLIGDRQVTAEPHPAATGSLSFKVADAPAGPHLVRVRVDGLDSPLVDRSADPPEFLDRRVVIT